MPSRRSQFNDIRNTKILWCDITLYKKVIIYFSDKAYFLTK